MNKKLPVVDEHYQRRLIKSSSKNIDNKDEQDILHRYYREPAYFFANFFLRNGRLPDDDESEGREIMDENVVFQSIRDMDSLFERAKPIDTPIIVYRGVTVGSLEQYKETKQFISTSFNPDVSLGVLHGSPCCMFSITVPVGTKAIFTGNSQQEVILDRNTIIKVNPVATKSVHGRDVYDTIAIPDISISLDSFIEDIKGKR